MIGICENSQIIKFLFKDRIPSFKQIEIHEIKIINREDLLCYLRFDLNEYPSEPPQKWVQAGYNTSQMSLQLIGSEIINFNIKGRIGKGDLFLEENNGKKVLKFIQNSVPNLIIESKWVYIDGITGYLK